MYFVLPRNQMRFVLASCIVALVVSLALPLAALAQGIPNPPIHPTALPPDGTPPISLPVTPVVDVQLNSIEALIDGSIASVKVTQRFFNPSTQQMEGTFVFPLPADATIGDFQMTVDGQVLEGKVYTADEARQIYEEIVRRQRDPALLEYLGQGLYQASVFPIPGGATRTVELTYRQVLTLDNDLYRFAVPLNSGPNRRAPENMAVSVALRNQPGLRTVYSPSHNVSISRNSDDSAQIGFETSDSAEMQDFVLYFGTHESAIGLDLLSYKPGSEDGFFLLLAAPGLETVNAEIVARDIVLALDVSGSMQGEKIEQARAAAQYIVENLNTEDQFNLISFSTGVDLWKPNLQPVHTENRSQALAWINEIQANGSTDINRALLEALAQVELSSSLGATDVTSRPAYVLFLTDGLPTQGVQDPGQIVTNAEQNTPQFRSLRLFTFGVGYDVNTDLLDTISRNLGGRSHYVRPGEAIDEAVSGFYAGISTPVLTNVSITVEGAQIEDTYPYPLPDLFAGEQLVWAGRYTSGGPVTVYLTGEVNGEERTFHYEDLSLAEHGGESAVARLWATRKIGAMLSEVRRSGASQEIIDAIVELSLAYGIVTPYTSYLVLEPGMTTIEDSPTLGIPGTEAPEARSMRYSADTAVTQALEEAASAEAVGAQAVESSITRAELETAEVAQDRQGVRYLAGKSFVQQGWVTTVDGETVPFWVDTSYEETMPTKTITFSSQAYFTVAQNSMVAQWFSLSPEMMVVLDGEAVRVTTSITGTEVLSPDLTQPASPEAQPEPRSFWQRLVDFVRDWLE